MSELTVTTGGADLGAQGGAQSKGPRDLTDDELLATPLEDLLFQARARSVIAAMAPGSPSLRRCSSH